jgi:hypothetical protein
VLQARAKPHVARKSGEYVVIFGSNIARVRAILSDRSSCRNHTLPLVFAVEVQANIVSKQSVLLAVTSIGYPAL